MPCSQSVPDPGADGTLDAHVPAHTVVGDLNHFLKGWREYHRYDDSTRRFAKLDQ